MLNRTPPSGNNNTSNVLNAYRKRRQQRGPFLIYGLAAILLIGGIALVVRATSRGDGPLSAIFATDTPTPNLTFTPTNTSTPTSTPTETLTPTITLTPTPSEPFPYTVQENEGLGAIAEKFNLGDDGVLLLYFQNPEIQSQFNGVVQAGQTILIPLPGTILPTLTPIPPNLARGTKIKYTVLAGDTLAGIAVRFNSLEQNIIDENNLENPNALDIGQVLEVPVNLVTPTATLPSTSTPVSPTVDGQQPQTALPAATTAVGSTPSACAPGENPTFVTDLQALINKARTDTGLPALTVNAKLASAAKVHATDLLCTNSLGHVGSDGSTPQERVADQAYTASVVIEDYYSLHPAYGINPQSAFNWWMSNSASRANILNTNVTEFGIAYVVSDTSLLGGYFIVVYAKP
jgi:uncharacterized protein YkwD